LLFSTFPPRGSDRSVSTYDRVMASITRQKPRLKSKPTAGNEAWDLLMDAKLAMDENPDDPHHHLRAKHEKLDAWMNKVAENRHLSSAHHIHYTRCIAIASWAYGN